MMPAVKKSGCAGARPSTATAIHCKVWSIQEGSGRAIVRLHPCSSRCTESVSIANSARIGFCAGIVFNKTSCWYCGIWFLKSSHPGRTGTLSWISLINQVLTNHPILDKNIINLAAMGSWIGSAAGKEIRKIEEKYQRITDDKRCQKIRLACLSMLVGMTFILHSLPRRQ